ncbi:hypothetical protein [Dryocola sp. BD626]|uniref:hypothetical protein n=1 Tax=Dryocola sp. BD626 TaxID=3133273 RepID=UPI003F4F83BA
MSAKERFFKKLQEKQPQAGVYACKSEADIAAFRLRMSELLGQIEEWLAGTDIRVESTSVSVVELLVGGKAFTVTGIALRYENRKVTFTPVFLYGQGVTGCVEVSLHASGSLTSVCRLFMRTSESSEWTWRPSGHSTLPGGVFCEEAFYNMISGLLP